MLKKRQKSYVSAFLAFAVLAASPIALTSAAHADDQTAISPIAVVAQTPTLSQDDAVKKARDILSLSEDKWTVGQISVRTGQDPNNNFNGHPSYAINFNQTTDGPTGYYVVIDGVTGRLLSMSHYDKTGKNTGDQTTESKQAIAEAFLQKVAPDEFKQCEIMKTPDQAMNPNVWSSFIYRRKANGLPVLGNQMTVSVGADGQIESYSLNWSDVTFTAPDSNIINMTQANQVYQQVLEMRLSYTNYYPGYGSVPLIKLVYQPAFITLNLFNGMGQINQPVIDAKTGKTLDATGQATTDVNLPAPKPIEPNGPTAPASLDHELTQTDAETLAQNSGLLPSDATMTDSSYQTTLGRKVWSLSYQTKNTNGSQNYFNISFNAKTGEIINFYGGKGEPIATGTALSDDQLLLKALEVVKKDYPDRLGAICAPNNNTAMKGNSSFFQFPLLKNGIPSDESIAVSLNPVTGNLINLSMNGSNQDFDTADYPSTDGVVSTDQAKSVYMKNEPLELAYLFPTNSDGTRSTTPVLVYTPTPSMYNRNVVDAKTGDWFNLSTIKQPNPTPTDIKGHWAEKVLTQFAERGLLEMDSQQAHPDQLMTRAQFVRLLVDFKQVGAPGINSPTFTDVPKDSKYYRQIETAVSENWIAKTDQFHPNANITREEAAAILARAQGFSDLAKHTEIFKLPYSDANSISAWAYGSVAIDYGLGFMKGVDATHFDPQATITLAQAATMLNQTEFPRS